MVKAKNAPIDASRPTHQQAVPVNFLLPAYPPHQGQEAGSSTSANSQVWTTLDSSLAWIAPQPLSIPAAPREQCR
ncbi:MAG: hypothetical protein ACJ8DI_15760, partial [Ktedonobacteraceae bacterium]